MPKKTGLTVRQHHRAPVDLRAEFEIAPCHREQVRFNAATHGSAVWVAPVLAMDVSNGGMGLHSVLFLPRHCQGTVRVFSPADRTVVLFEQMTRVQRARLSHDQTYIVGLAFLEPGSDISARIERMLAVVAGTSEVPRA